jgi:hypothetical protein
MVELLIASGADVNIAGLMDDGSALHMALYGCGDVVGMVSLLLNGGGDRDALDSRGRTAADVAEENGHEDAVALLLSMDVAAPVAPPSDGLPANGASLFSFKEAHKPPPEMAWGGDGVAPATLADIGSDGIGGDGEGNINGELWCPHADCLESLISYSNEKLLADHTEACHRDHESASSSSASSSLSSDSLSHTKLVILPGNGCDEPGVPASAVTLAAEAYQLGVFQRQQSVAYIKRKLAQLQPIPFENMVLYLNEDVRSEDEDHRLKNSETVEEIMRYLPPQTSSLELLVMAIDQCDILIQVRDGLTHDGELDLEGWDTLEEHRDPSGCQGVSINEFGEITKLRLCNLGLKGLFSFRKSRISTTSDLRCV